MANSSAPNGVHGRRKFVELTGHYRPAGRNRPHPEDHRALPLRGGHRGWLLLHGWHCPCFLQVARWLIEDLNRHRLI